MYCFKSQKNDVIFKLSLGKISHWERFPIGPSNLPVVMALLDERLANRTQKRMLCVVVAIYA